ncbi:MAG: 6-bladed beta-propeller [Terriglobia bacterium]|jgi:DNA-binding beta-propeller fold protein YncE|nr:6-bladed beta-propeller [Terriglobia bacterium]
MSSSVQKVGRFIAILAAVISIFVLLLATPPQLYGEKKDKKDKKKQKQQAAEQHKTFLDVLDYSKIVWPNPPAITRVRYINYFSGERFKETTQNKPAQKASWMDRLAGISVGNTSAAEKPRFQLIMPYGMAVDSKNRLYIADRKVSAIFVVNPETGEFEMIKNGVHARFGTIIGLAIDDSDRLFVSDSTNHRIIVFTPDFKVEGSFSSGLADPGGLAIDNENRFLYVPDAELDQVFVFDADPPYKLIRKIGTGGKQHTLTTPGDFAKPSNVAVDSDGNLYVSDTLNDRVEIFDADGNFIRTWGKPGDGPGYFARPKGIAIDSDGHVWVADGVQDRLQVFTQQGRLLLYMGGNGLLPGQFSALAGLAIDKNNRVFTSEQYPGRVQIFRYTTDEEARAEKLRRDGEEQSKPLQKAASPKANPETGHGTPAVASPQPREP